MPNSNKLIVSLPVKDLEKSKAFFAKLGFGFNPQFTDQNAACMVRGEDMYAMLLAEGYFKTFTKKGIADSSRTTEVIIALSAESKAEVDAMVDAALAAGAGPFNPTQDMGFMYQRSFQDLDGHQWEVLWLDMTAAA